MTVVRGFIGSYPSAFWRVNESALSVLMDTALQESYRTLMDRFGVRRTSENFWQHSDQLHASYRSLAPITGGLLDFNRLENR